MTGLEPATTALEAGTEKATCPGLTLAGLQETKHHTNVLVFKKLLRLL
jgi:hypothetical protein